MAAHNYASMTQYSLQNIEQQWQIRERLPLALGYPGATVAALAIDIKASNPSLKYRKQYLVGALDRLEREGRVRKEMRDISNRSMAMVPEFFFFLNAVQQSNYRVTSKLGKLIKKPAVAPSPRKGFTLKAPGWEQCWDRVITCANTRGTPASLKELHVDNCVTSRLLLVNGKSLDSVTKQLADSMRRRERPSFEAAETVVRDSFSDGMVSEERLPLCDPHSMMRLACPVRTVNCRHMRAFDLETHLTLSLLSHRRSNRGDYEFQWQCPVCRQRAPWSKLRFDVYVDHVSALSHFRICASCPHVCDIWPGPCGRAGHRYTRGDCHPFRSMEA
jgi:hypothetical protein